jgi:hypothetical protein
MVSDFKLKSSIPWMAVGNSEKVSQSIVITSNHSIQFPGTEPGSMVNSSSEKPPQEDRPFPGASKIPEFNHWINASMRDISPHQEKESVKGGGDQSDDP